MPHASPSIPRHSQPAARGIWLVGGLLLLGAAAAVGAIWFQREQTRRCLDFYGAAAARRITSAPRAELVMVQPGGGRRLAATAVLDVSQAAGLVHLRRGLVEDANFTWSEPRDGRPAEAPRPLESWDAALIFSDRDGGGRTMLVVDLDGPDGALAVVGQPGRIGLGRIAPGLRTWIRDSWARASRPGAAAAEPADPAAKSR